MAAAWSRLHAAIGFSSSFASVLDAVQCRRRSPSRRWRTQRSAVLRRRNPAALSDQRSRRRRRSSMVAISSETASHVAARIEGLAEPGSIAISDAVNEHVPQAGRGRLRRSRRARGRRTSLVRCSVSGSIPKATLPEQWPRSIPAEPDLADNRVDRDSSLRRHRGDQEQGYFARRRHGDIVTDPLEEVYRPLRHRAQLLVRLQGPVSRHPKVSRELGVPLCAGRKRAPRRQPRAHQRADDRRADRRPSLGGRYDRDLEDIFAVQDEVTRTIVDRAEGQLTAGEERARRSAAGSRPRGLRPARPRRARRCCSSAPKARSRRAKCCQRVIELGSGQALAYGVCRSLTFAEFANRAGMRRRRKSKRARWNADKARGRESRAAGNMRGAPEFIGCGASTSGGRARGASHRARSELRGRICLPRRSARVSSDNTRARSRSTRARMARPAVRHGASFHGARAARAWPPTTRLRLPSGGAWRSRPRSDMSRFYLACIYGKTRAVCRGAEDLGRAD